jgi:hypothetical protein
VRGCCAEILHRTKRSTGWFRSLNDGAITRHDFRRPGSSEAYPLRGWLEVVLTKQVNPRHVERRVAAAARRLGAGESCLCGERGRQRLERLGSGSSSAQHAQRGGSAIRGAGLARPRDVQEPDGASAEKKECAELRINRSGHALIAPLTSRDPDSANCFWTGQAPTPGDDGGRS